MKQESLPSIKELYRSLESAGVDLYGFGVVVCNGSLWIAEPDILDTLLLALENSWFTEDKSGDLTHAEFREDIFQLLWRKSKDKKPNVKMGVEVPIGQEEMAFYQLPKLTRAALYLRVKKSFSYSSIAMILETPEGVIREEIEKGREALLGRGLKHFDFSEDEF